MPASIPNTARGRLYLRLCQVQLELIMEGDMDAMDVLCDEVLDDLWAKVEAEKEALGQ